MSGTERDRRSLAWGGAVGFVAIMVALTLAKLTTAGFPFRGGDEQGHFAYVAFLAETGDWWPDVAAMPLYDLSGAARDGLNFINHPPLFYWTAVPVYEALQALGAGPKWLRAYTLVFSFAAFAALGALMVRARFGPLAMAAIAGAMAFLLVPTFASFFNNDQFALLGGALACCGALRRVADRGDRTGLALALIGVALCSVKLTALLMVGVFLAVAFVGRDLRRPDLRALGPLACVGALVTIPFAVYLARYGSPAPETPGHIEALRAFMVELGWDRTPRLTVWEYLATVPRLFAYQLGNGTLAFFGFAALCAAPLVVFRTQKDPADEPAATVARAGLVATYVVLAIHVAFAWRRYEALGWLGDLYPRYYFPLLGAYALGWGLFLRRGGSRAAVLWRRAVSAIRPQFSVHRAG